MTVNELLDQPMTKEAVNLIPLLQKALAAAQTGVRATKSGLGTAKSFAGNKANWGGANYKELIKNLQRMKKIRSGESSQAFSDYVQRALRSSGRRAGGTAALHGGALAGGAGAGFGLKELIQSLGGDSGTDTLPEGPEVGPGLTY